MQIRWRDPADEDELARLIRGERDAKQRDRYRCVALAVEGRDAPTIAAMLGRSRKFVQRWAYAYRDGGVEAIGEKPRPGRPTKLPRDREEAFRQRMLAGPTEADGGLCTLRGRDAVRVLQQEFGVAYSLGGAYDLLHRLDFSCLKPRPRFRGHRKNDPGAMAAWEGHAPFCPGGEGQAPRPEGRGLVPGQGAVRPAPGRARSRRSGPTRARVRRR